MLHVICYSRADDSMKGHGGRLGVHSRFLANQLSFPVLHWPLAVWITALCWGGTGAPVCGKHTPFPGVFFEPFQSPIIILQTSQLSDLALPHPFPLLHLKQKKEQAATIETCELEIWADGRSTTKFQTCSFKHKPRIPKRNPCFRWQRTLYERPFDSLAHKLVECSII